jgi:peptidase E
LSLLFFNGLSLCSYKTVPHITMPSVDVMITQSTVSVQKGRVTM